MRSNPSIFACFRDYILLSSLLKSSILWHAALSECIVFSIVSFFATAPDRSTEKGSRYGRMLDSVDSGIIVPLPSFLIEAMSKFGFFYVFPSISSDAALAYSSFHCTCEIG